jgi:hypothetical protein
MSLKSDNKIEKPDFVTPQEKGFIIDVVGGATGTDAALKNFPLKNKNSAGSKASQLFKKPKIVAIIKSLADAFPEKDLIKVHKEGLAATTLKPHLVDRDDKGRPVYEYMLEDDYAVRHKYLDTAYKLKGAYAPEKSINLNINQENSPEKKEKAEAFDLWFKKQQTSKT